MSSSWGSFRHKLVELEGLALYWDNNTQHIHEQTASVTPFFLERSAPQKRLSIKGDNHTYLLAPVNGQALLKRNTSSLPLKTEVRNICSLVLGITLVF